MAQPREEVWRTEPLFPRAGRGTGRRTLAALALLLRPLLSLIWHAAHSLRRVLLSLLILNSCKALQHPHSLHFFSPRLTEASIAAAADSLATPGTPNIEPLPEDVPAMCVPGTLCVAREPAAMRPKASFVAWLLSATLPALLSE